jgi:hypothetical protein
MMVSGFGGDSIKRQQARTTIVISIPNNEIDALKLHIAAYAGEVPKDVAAVLWQVHRNLGV